jgi:EAL domain-containing protein (putative c-di-GMP-specific phosphodiesterase class I)
MRIWEFEDNRAAPSDLVREQDFIMRVRRLNRAGTPYLVINLVLSAVEALEGQRASLEATQQRLQEFSKITNGYYAEMSNGDVFLAWEESSETHVLPSRLMGAILPESTNAEDTGKFLLIFRLPADYTPLRERINHYIEVAQAAASLGASTPGQALKAAGAGPLTAWSVDQIEKLLSEIDLRRYVRTQPIYQYGADGGWKPLIEEYFVSFEDLKRERFPKLEIAAPEHLFLELCQALDRRLLADLTQRFEGVAGRRIHLNLSVTSVMGPVFAQFCFGVPKNQRSLIGFELRRGDLLQDFTATLDAMMALHREGFKVAIDAVTPDLVNYLNLAAFEADYIKINVSKDRAGQLADPTIRKGLAQIPKEKLIFFRCDSEKALAAGLELGVSLFQGWLIDDAARPQPRGA